MRRTVAVYLATNMTAHAVAQYFSIQNSPPQEVPVPIDDPSDPVNPCKQPEEPEPTIASQSNCDERDARELMQLHAFVSEVRHMLVAADTVCAILVGTKRGDLGEHLAYAKAAKETVNKTLAQLA